MRKINLSEFPESVNSVISEPNPLSEDIALLDKEGDIISVIIGIKPYKYLLKKIEEDEEIIDYAELKNFDSKEELNKSIDFEDFLKGE